MSRRFFLSHSTKDNHLVSLFMDLMRLGMDLREKDIFCTSKLNIEVGESYIDTIRENFNKAEIIIMLISRNYMDSPFCLCEMGAAWASDKKLIPLLIDIDYRTIEYPTTPFKTIQVGDLKNMDYLLLIFDDLREQGYIQAKTSPFNTQLAIFKEKEPWLYPVLPRHKVIDSPKLTAAETEFENLVNELTLRQQALKLLTPLSEYNLRGLEPASRILANFRTPTNIL